MSVISQTTAGGAEGAGGPPPSDDVVTAQQAAALLHVRSVNTVQALIKRGKIAAVRMGEPGGSRIPRAEIAAYLATPDFAALQAEERALDEADAYGVPDEDVDAVIAQIREERRAARE